MKTSWIILFHYFSFSFWENRQTIPYEKKERKYGKWVDKFCDDLIENVSATICITKQPRKFVHQPRFVFDLELYSLNIIIYFTSACLSAHFP